MIVRQILKRILRIMFWVLLALATLVWFTLFIGRSPMFYVGILVVICFAVVLFLALDKTAKALGERVRQAKPAELKREDDVLLQAVAFSQSVLFIYLNLMESSDVIVAFKILVPSFAVSFYALRAWGKIKNDTKYRYYSIWVFFSIVLITITVIANTLVSSVYGEEGSALLGFFNGGFYLGSRNLIKEIFKKRYGYS